ncbi:sialoadhesin-like isoform X2 [Salarias fasciatus]|uniref:sialoadhesin-like isoform X2 n=1 Tax=Salarias fasciatus TaxID=181472 RepID=UPI0011764EA5|nr:sialoadhesin-like isoform X2 [Salarias fasciatus]
MGLTAARCGFVVFLLWMPVLHCTEPGWGVTYTSTNICAVEGSTVDISCSYIYPPTYKVVRIIWTTKGHESQPLDLREDPQYSKRVRYHCSNNNCTLTIKHLSSSDSGQYFFRFITDKWNGRFTGQPGVTLTVTGLPTVFYTNSRLQCYSSGYQCPGHVSYVRYKNGEKISGEPTFDWVHSRDSYSCAVEGHEDFPSPPQCFNHQPCNRVTYQNRNICAMKGSSVDISCQYRSSEGITSTYWFSPSRRHQWVNSSWPEKLSEDPQFAGRVGEYYHTLRISDVRESDSAEYRFTFKTGSFEWRSSLPGVTLTVTGVFGQQCNRVNCPDRRICAALGSSVDISCFYKSSSHVKSKFWFSADRSRDQHRLPEDLRNDPQFANRVEVLETEGFSTLRISDLRDDDSIQYHFKFTTSDSTTSRSLSGTRLTVTALQVKVITETIHPSHTEAELECDSKCHQASHVDYVWFNNGVKVKNKKRLYEARFHPGDVISCALEGHESHASPPLYVLNVPSVSVSPSGEIMENSSVTLTCSNDATQSRINTTWYKNKETVVGLGPQLVLQSIRSSDSGQYYCTSENEWGKRTSQLISIDVEYPPKTIDVSVSLHGAIVEGSSVTLTCSSDANPAASYTWYRNHHKLAHGPEGTYHFPSISWEDRGTYSCKSENKHGTMSLSRPVDVQYGPKLPSVSVSPSGEIVEGSSVTLTCSSDANPAASYSWYREGEDTPQASDKIFTISDISLEHSGNYSCVAQNSRGRHAFTINLLVRKSGKAAVVGATTAVILVLVFFAVFILLRKRICKQTPEPGARPNISEQRRVDREQQEEPAELHYASVHFSKQKDECLYSNIRPVQPHRPMEEEEEDAAVLYSAIRRTNDSRATSQDSVENLYSTVSKIR